MGVYFSAMAYIIVGKGKNIYGVCQEEKCIVRSNSCAQHGSWKHQHCFNLKQNTGCVQVLRCICKSGSSAYGYAAEVSGAQCARRF